jgi:hypothetical protein
VPEIFNGAVKHTVPGLVIFPPVGKPGPLVTVINLVTPLPGFAQPHVLFIALE